MNIFITTERKTVVFIFIRKTRAKNGCFYIIYFDIIKPKVKLFKNRPTFLSIKKTQL